MKIAGIIITLLIVTGTRAQEASLYKREVFRNGGDTLLYRIMYPSKYDVNKKYPVILFLHGSGERGSDNESQLLHGGSLFADSVNRIKFPAFVIFPQCPKNDFWARIKQEHSPFYYQSDVPVGKSLGLVAKLVDSFARTPQVEKTKIYIGGLSMGGMGTFELLWRKPNFFAAAVPICGGGDDAKASVYGKNFPVWVFHGAADDVVPASHSRAMVKTLKAAGANAIYTEYPGIKHDSWNNAFAEPGLLKWLFDQEKK